MSRRLPPPTEMDVAVRAWAVPAPSRGDIGPSEWTLVLDTETTADAAQALRVGCYELRHRGELKHAGLFYEPASLSQAETELLSAYAAARGLRVWTRDEFAEEVFLKAAWELRALIVGHNLPFDLARISIGCRPCQSRNRSMRGGFTLQISENTKLSRVQVKKTNAGAAFIRLTIPSGISPEIRGRQRGGEAPNHHGYFLDTATLGGSLLGGRPTLKALAKKLRTETQKGEADHGEELNESYLGYLSDDVRVTWECWVELERRYANYALPTPPWKIHSEAGIGKAHLKKMNLTPFHALSHWPPSKIATVMETYYGGWAGCAIRRLPVPGVLVDFKSEYPTVFVLQACAGSLSPRTPHGQTRTQPASRTYSSERVFTTYCGPSSGSNSRCSYSLLRTAIDFRLEHAMHARRRSRPGHSTSLCRTARAGRPSGTRLQTQSARSCLRVKRRKCSQRSVSPQRAHRRVSTQSM